MKDRKKRLVGLVAQIVKFRDEKAKEDAEIEEGKKKNKKKVEDPADAAIPVEDRETSVKLAEIKLLNMEKLAKEAADQGVVPFLWLLSMQILSRRLHQLQLQSGQV
jgi:hypothetical protein